LIGEGYLHEDELEGLGDDKMTKILFLAGKIEGPVMKRLKASED